MLTIELDNQESRADSEPLNPKPNPKKGENMAKKTADERYQEFLIKKAMEALGGEEKAIAKFYGSKVKHELEMDHTFGELWGLAESEGWDEHLLGMKLSILLDAPSAKRKAGKGKRTRNPADPKAILAFIDKNPGCKKGAIKKAVDGNLGNKVKDLVNEKMVKKDGDKAAAVYTILAKGKKELAG